MALETFNVLAELSQSMKGESCLPKEPFMKLGDGQQAPILNYSLEQKSSFTAYGHFLANIPDSSFKAATANVVPAGNIFDKVAAMTIDEVKESLIKDLKRGSGTLLKAIGGGVLKESPNVEAAPNLPLAIGNTGANTDEIATAMKTGKVPILHNKMGKYQTILKEISRPAAPKGKIFVIEEYTTASYLGDYGAGQTLRTFSLLPDEKMTVTLRTFETSTQKKTRAENVLDSFSEASTNEMEDTMEKENNVNTDISGSVTNVSKVTLDVSGVTPNLIKIGGSASVTNTINVNASRAANVRALNRALEKHVQSSNSNREISFNETSETTTTTEIEETTVRELVNLNKSRVLNFVFRQLLQEYVTITYLSNIRIAFCNGYPESLKIVDLEDIDTLINTYINDANKTSVKNEILKHYCKVFNYKSELKDFIEKITVNYGQCLGISENAEFWRIRPTLEDSYARTNGLAIKVKGVILNVQTHTLRTPSVVADALLGQGEALDCFNTRLQDAAAVKTHLENAALLQQMEIVQGIEDSKERAAAYKKVFGTCCTSDVIVPQ